MTRRETPPTTADFTAAINGYDDYCSSLGITPATAIDNLRLGLDGQHPSLAEHAGAVADILAPLHSSPNRNYLNARMPRRAASYGIVAGIILVENAYGPDEMGVTEILSALGEVIKPFHNQHLKDKQSPSPSRELLIAGNLALTSSGTITEKWLGVLQHQWSIPVGQRDACEVGTGLTLIAATNIFTIRNSGSVPKAPDTFDAWDIALKGLSSESGQ